MIGNYFLIERVRAVKEILLELVGIVQVAVYRLTSGISNVQGTLPYLSLHST